MGSERVERPSIGLEPTILAIELRTLNKKQKLSIINVL